MKSFLGFFKSGEISGIKDRVSKLEEAIERVLEKRADEFVSRAERKVVNQNPNSSRINVRFRGYETAILNIKNIGYNIGKALYDARKDKPARGPEVIELKSKLCTQDDIESDWVNFWCQEIRSAPIYHRKVWELCYIAQAIYNSGKLKPGMKGLVFGCGDEPLPSLFAKYGCSVVATDLSPAEASDKGWVDTNQHASGLDLIRKPGICPNTDDLNRISLEYVDMTDIPHRYHGEFDFCWSACAFEHLGSIAKGLDFVENSLKCLKPGGIAVHTTEYNMIEDGETIDNWPTVLFQKRHIVDFIARIRAGGYHVADLDLHPGDKILDGFVDLPPWSLLPTRMSHEGEGDVAHLKLSVDGFPCTSLGLIISKPVK